MPGKEVIPAFGTVLKENCSHDRAAMTTFICPDCRGIMRRCCQSILSWPHEKGCAYDTNRRKK